MVQGKNQDTFEGFRDRNRWGYVYRFKILVSSYVTQTFHKAFNLDITLSNLFIANVQKSSALHVLYFVCKDENETHAQNKYDLSKVSQSKWRIQVTGDIEEGYNSFKRNFVLLYWFWKENYRPLSLKNGFFQLIH